ncbi:uncharacterized protein LMH87_007808 [Akanthomyces muscarius]|uniref:WSC domain-containing protein n=1 Tax=Akanthomyces muscarius TaxID=2231603 RepID=A0A9W8UR03_AKAMU|nr:uncharacterized protein LMH87_007808 [Akanthomyces muscarius]KAJ4159870.1 hypothetical protein LMH87_007808 [Akanthomyces muscarius]
MAPTASIIALAATALLGQLSRASYTEQPPCTDPFTPFAKLGCVSKSDFDFRSAADQASMTVAKCTAVCKGNSYRYAALTYYGVCYCGNVITGQQQDDSKCSYKCTGNPDESCGGPDSSYSVWQDPTFPKTADQVSVSDYQAQGCYTDQSPRSLGHPQSIDGGVTPEKCISACKAQGYPYAGTEYGGECWCDSYLASQASKVSDAECQKPCSGDGSKTCGGANRINIYFAKDLESTEPCTSSVTTSSTTATPTPTTSTSSTSSVTTTTGTSTTSTGTGTTSTSTGTGTTSTGTTSTGTTSTGTTSTGTTSTGTTSTGTTSTGTTSTGTTSTGTTSTGTTSTGTTSTGTTSTGTTSTGTTSTGTTSTGTTSTGTTSTGTGTTSTSTGTSTTSTGTTSTGTGTTSTGTGTSTTSTTTTTSSKTFTTSTRTSTTSSCVPAPTQVCVEGSDWIGHEPICGVPLPPVSCSDNKGDYGKNPFKLFNLPDKSKCPIFPKASLACIEACGVQLKQCLKATCLFGRDGLETSENDGHGKRTLGLIKDIKCKKQFALCVAANKLINPNVCKDYCPK